MPKLLTVAAAEKLKPDPDRRREILDGGAPGLYLCIQPSGHKSWVLRGRRPDGRKAKVTLGPLDLLPDDGHAPTLGTPLSLRAARTLANQLLRQKAQGVDIAEAKVALSRQRQVGDGFLAVAEEFINDHARPNNRRWRETARVLGLKYPSDHTGDPELIRGGLAQRWATKPFADLGGADIHGVIIQSRRHGIPGSTPKGDADPSESRGRAVAAALGKLFSWATEQRLIPVNPAAGMYRPKPPASRARVLTDAEVAAVWWACDRIGYPFGHVVKLLLLSGQRRNEVAGMQWSELSSDTNLSLPPSRTKNKQPHQVPLPPLARDIIASVPRVVGVDFLFSTTGTTSISGFSKFKRQLDELIGDAAAPWQLHDARRTVVTGMAELGVQPHIIEAVVNHISGHKGGVAGVYNRAAYAAEKRAALQLWADHIAEITAGDFR